MNDELDNEESHQKGWLERLSQVLLREPHDKEELTELLRHAAERGIIANNALQMIEGVLSVSELQARDIMVPRSQMVVVEIDETVDEFLPRITESGHSRFPVIGENRDEVIGILLAKDLLNYDLKKEGSNQAVQIDSLLRKAIFIPESKRVDVLLREFRMEYNHMAIVVDEYGGVSGLITIEDILEEIVGEIEDEYDMDDEVNITTHDQRHFIIKAITPIEEFNEYFNLKWSDEEFDTVGGILVAKLGHLPKKGEHITFDDLNFKILQADSRRVKTLELILAEEYTAKKQIA
ncbi:MAG: magnesium/cobalt efflux protein [Gammaproteobacteria bacterium]|jgi:magnesium and cobalt transporter|nr:magnesium/cobalt efflux protein [Gammaproteobacteria bacterium]